MEIRKEASGWVVVSDPFPSQSEAEAEMEKMKSATGEAEEPDEDEGMGMGMKGEESDDTGMGMGGEGDEEEGVKPAKKKGGFPAALVIAINADNKKRGKPMIGGGKPAGKMPFNFQKGKKGT